MFWDLFILVFCYYLFIYAKGLFGPVDIYRNRLKIVFITVYWALIWLYYIIFNHFLILDTFGCFKILTMLQWKSWCMLTLPKDVFGSGTSILWSTRNFNFSVVGHIWCITSILLSKVVDQHIFHQWCVLLFISPQLCQHLVLWVLNFSSLMYVKYYFII